MVELIRDSHLFDYDVKARHDKMVGMVETMRMTADGQRLTDAKSREEDVAGIHNVP